MKRAAVAVAALLLVGTASPASAADGPVPSRVLFSFADDAVIESSGLVDDGDVVYTTNDSGDDAVLYGVDARSGRTVSRTTYADEVDDVEALAPGLGGTVWVGDIGDNREGRDAMTVLRVTPGSGDSSSTAPAFDLTYPDGPHDAETLLAHPRTGRLFVVSKSVFGGTVYAAPRRLSDGPNRMRAFARVPGLLTDGAFLPDGKHVVLRTYGTASVYTFPAFERVGTVTLPRQKQGEGIAVGRDGRVLVSSEGVGAEVLQVDLPASLTDPSPGASPSGPPPATRPPPDVPVTDKPARTPGQWVGLGAATLGVAVLGWFAVRMSRVRGPR